MKDFPDMDQYINYEEYYLQHIAKAKRSGDKLNGLCPFHEDHNASFGADVNTGQWKCLTGCGQGNVISFHARLHEVSNQESYRDLCRLYNVPTNGSRPNPYDFNRARPQGQQQGQKTQPTRQQPDSKSIPLSTLDEFKNIPEELKRFAIEKRGWTEEIIKRFQIGYSSKRQRYTIPIYDERGDLVNIRLYAPGQENKVISWGKGYGESRLYPLSTLETVRKHGGLVVLTEGEPDCLSGLSQGLMCITQTAGCETWKDPFNAQFKGLNVLIAYDNDQAGRNGAERVARHLPHFARSVEAIQWPEWMEEKEDLTDWFVKYGKTVEELLKLPRVKYGEQAEEQQEHIWEIPSDLTRQIPKAPAFPLDCLPYVAANYAEDEAERMQAPVDLIAVPMLVTFAGLIGSGAVIRPKAKDDWSERACFFACAIASVSAMKSSCLNKATAPLRRFQKQLAEEDEKNVAQWKLECGEAKERHKAWKAECQRVLKQNPDAELPPEPQIPTEPSRRRVITNDSTIEKFADFMTSSRGMTLFRDELAGFLLNMSRYNSGSDRQFYLECYSGGSYSVDRVSRGEQFVSDLYLNILGGIQPGVAKKIFSIDPEVSDGFFERFGLITYPEQSTTYKHVDRWPNRDKRDFFNDMCSRLADANWKDLLQADDFGSKPFARFDDQAQPIFDKWLVGHMKTIKAMSDEDPMAGMMGKARGLLVRLVLVLHLAAWAANEMPDPQWIEPQSLNRAIKLLDEYLIPMWKRIFAAFGKTAADDGAHRIAKWIREEGLREVKLRDIQRKHWTGLLDGREIQAAVDMLIAHRWLGEVTKVKKGGRPSEAYPVNPLVHEQK